MSAFFRALLLSLAVHALLGAAVIVLVSEFSGEVELPELDLTAVELSLADDETSDLLAQSVAAAPSPHVPPPPQDAVRPEAPPSALDAAALPPVAKSVEDYRSAPQFTEKMSSPPSVPAEASSLQPARRQAKIDAPPSLKRNIRPEYPKSALKNREEGRVELEIEINALGAVVSAKVAVSCGFPVLDAAALKAVRAASFRPARAGESAVSAKVRLPVVFRLKDRQ